MQDLKQQIVKEYKKTKVVHPTYGEIGRKLGCTREYVRQVINSYKKQKTPV